jgi:hypothetical protein
VSSLMCLMFVPSLPDCSVCLIHHTPHAHLTGGRGRIRHPIHSLLQFWPPHPPRGHDAPSRPRG